MNPMDPFAENMQADLQKLLLGRKNLKEAFELSDDRISALTSYAAGAAEHQNWEDALFLLSGLELIDPDNAGVHTCLGILLMQRKQWELAIAEFQYTLSCDPGQIAAWTNLGEIRFQQGNIKEAILMWKKAIEFDPQGKDRFASRARLLLETVTEMMRDYKKEGQHAFEKFRNNLQTSKK